MTRPATTPKTVADIMTGKPLVVTGAADVRDLARLFDENDISGVPVVDSREQIIGVVSKTDILHRALEGPPGARPGASFFSDLDGNRPDWESVEDLGRAEDFMSIDPVTATPDEGVALVAHRMAEERVHRAIVVDEERRPIGIVTTLDVLRVYPI